ncbi:MAG: AbrB family transcriptional regulator [Alphaproteobacteria bacterium]|nr:AbrB family transcriptional regulator [Alphaproteobacteria bacterium]
MTIALGAVGGAVFYHFRLPLAWMLGAMTVTTIAAVLRVPVRLPTRLRSAFIVVLGIMLGSAFVPGTFAHLAEWSVTIAGIALYVALAGASGFTYFQRIGGRSPVTAFFSAMPGGLTEMTLQGEALGGDVRVIALVHALRTAIIVFTLPFLIRLVSDGGAPPQPPPIGATEGAPIEYLLLAVGGGVGWLVAHRLRIPTAAVIGPMVVSAALHVTGFVTVSPPFWLVWGAQVVIGAAVGCRFVGTTAREFRTIGLLGCGSTVLLIVYAAAIAAAGHLITGLRFEAILLAMAPGGMAEMSLVSLALHVDPAFVTTHHVFRIILIVMVAPYVFRRLPGRGRIPTRR